MSSSLRKGVRRWLWALAPVAIYAGLIVLLSSQSELPSVGLLSKVRAAFAKTPLASLFGFDKIEHFIEYGIFGFLIARAVQILGPPAQHPRKTWILATLLGAAFGASDEIHQYFVPGRDASVFDLIADTLGSGTGALAWLSLSSLRRPSNVKIGAKDDPSLPI